MSGVKRYLINRVREDDGLIGLYQLDETGEKFVHIDVKFVLATDYDQLLAERDASLATTAKLREALTTVRATIPHLGGAEKSTRWLCEIIDAALPTPSVTP